MNVWITSKLVGTSTTSRCSQTLTPPKNGLPKLIPRALPLSTSF